MSKKQGYFLHFISKNQTYFNFIELFSMKLPLWVYTPLFVFGVVDVFLSSALPSLYFVGGLFVICMLASYLSRHVVMHGFTVMVLGFLVASFYGHFIWFGKVPGTYLNKPIQLNITIENFPKRTRWGQRCTATTYLPKTHQPVRMLLNWPSWSEALAPGQQWAVSVRLRKMIMHHKKDFSFFAWMMANNINAKGSVVLKQGAYLIKSEQVIHSVTSIRFWLLHQLQPVLPDYLSSKLILALMLGDRDYFNEPMWNTLQKTGTNHLVAIAGLHVGFLMLIVFYGIRFLACLFPNILLYMPVYQLSALCGLCASFIYALCSGFAIPVQRALMMMFVFASGLLLKRYVTLMQSYCLALGGVIFLHPASVLSQSFWLSFVSVGMIIFSMTGYRAITMPFSESIEDLLPVSVWKKMLFKSISILKPLLKLQWVISLGIIPLTLWFFSTVSWIATVANLIVVPWVGLLILPLCFLATLLAAFHFQFSEYIFQIAGWNLDKLWHVLEVLSKLPFASSAFSISMQSFVFLLLFVLCVLSPVRLRTKCLSLVLLLPVIFNAGLDHGMCKAYWWI